MEGTKTTTKLFIIYVLLIALSLLAIVQCSAQNASDYLRDFKADAAKFDKKLYLSDPKFVEKNEPLYMEDADGKKIAVDAYVAHHLHTIYVDIGTNMWVKHPKVLIYHELGHYYFTRGHNNTQFFDGSPVTLMTTGWYSYGLDWSLVPPAKQDYYLKELFNK